MATAQERLRALIAAKKSGVPAAKVTEIIETPTKVETIDSSGALVVTKPALPTLAEVKPVEYTSAVSSDHALSYQLRQLEEAMHNNLPNFNTLLRDIHMAMVKDPETVTILSDEEIGVIVSGLTRIQNISIAPAAKSTGSRAKKSGLPVTAGMLT